MEFLCKSLKDKKTAIIISADHGLIDTKEKDRIIELKNYPEFLETLALPLSGEPRVAYCYVRPHKIKQFKNYVNTNFKKYCELHKSEDLIKENYIMKDLVLGEEQQIFIGNHGGVSKEEMFVPLIVVG